MAGARSQHSVDWSQVSAFRLRRHHLASKSQADLAEVEDGDLQRDIEAAIPDALACLLVLRELVGVAAFQLVHQLCIGGVGQLVASRFGRLTHIEIVVPQLQRPLAHAR